MKDTSYKQQTRQKYKLSHQQRGLPPHSALTIRGKTRKNSVQISPYTKLTQTTGPNLRGQKPKKRKDLTFKPLKRDLKYNILKMIIMKMLINTAQMKE